MTTLAARPGYPKLRLALLFCLGCLAGAGALRAVQHAGFEIPVPAAVIADGAVYEGDLVDGVIEGQGRMLWRNGDRYEGGFKDGLFHGQGHFQGADGRSYRGDYVAGAATGTGSIIYSEDERYSGEVLDSIMHGRGRLESFGTNYDGEFADNRYNGQGTFTDSEGNSYIGEFLDNDFHGQGEYLASDGARYSGTFVDGRLTGEGSYRDNHGTHYEGGFVDWYYDGDGELVDRNGDRYRGVFKQGELNGKGSYRGKDGSNYDGEFKNGYYSGQGVYTSAKGDVYDGEFRYGRYHGRGKLTYARPLDNIDSLVGTWSNGVLVEAIEPALLVNPGIINETVLYNQPALLRQSWQALEGNDPNKVDLYFLGISGDGSQAVFRREVQFVKKYFDEHLNTRNKSIALINARSTVEEVPLATRTSIRQSLAEIARRMDPQNDILFIYMTSHGSDDFELSLNQTRMQLPNLSAAALAEMLNELPMRWKVVVVSACYSGGFIPPLQNDGTLVITAAGESRTSFGCSDDAEFTYFGRAYFEQAFAESHDFVQAFERALEIVRQREADEGFEHSQPQIHKPQAIQDQLALWYRDNIRIDRASAD